MGTLPTGDLLPVSGEQWESVFPTQVVKQSLASVSEWPRKLLCQRELPSWPISPEGLYTLADDCYQSTVAIYIYIYVFAKCSVFFLCWIKPISQLLWGYLNIDEKVVCLFQNPRGQIRVFPGLSHKEKAKWMHYLFLNEKHGCERSLKFIWFTRKKWKGPPYETVSVQLIFPFPGNYKAPISFGFNVLNEGQVNF